MHESSPSRSIDRAAAPRLEGRSPAYYAMLLAPLILLTEIAALELTLVYPALPAMAAEFRTPSIGWALAMVSLVGAIAQPLLGKVADAIGKKRMIVFAAGLFAVGSLICALAPSYPVLLVGRAVQGSCMIVAPAAYGLIRDVFPARIVPVALGTITTGIGLSAIAGPVIGGALTDAFGFRAVFWFSLVYVLVLTPVFMLALPESPIRYRRKLDVMGGVLLGCAAGGFLLFISQGAVWGWSSAPSLAVLAGFAVACVLFVSRERRITEPLIDLRLLAGPRLRWTLVATFGGAFAIGGSALAVPMLVQTPDSLGYGLGMSALGTALFIVPQGLIAAACGPVGGLVARRQGPRLSFLIGLAALVTSATTMAVLHTEIWHFLVAGTIMGVGFGFFFVSASNLVIEAVPSSHTAVGTGLMGVANNLGNATGVTVLSAILAQHVANTDSSQIVRTEAGYILAFAVAAGAAMLALLVAAGMRHGRTPARGGR